MNMKQALRSYAGRRVLITGHTGFKGSWLASLLKIAGAELMGFALPPEPGPSHFHMLALGNDLRHVSGDIRDPGAVAAAMQEFQPEYVFHLAAQALVKRSYDDPVATFHTNVLGSVHVLDAVRHCPSVRSLVYITSDKCYENVEWVWGYREEDRLGGRDPYSASKAAAELAYSTFARSYFANRPDFGSASTRAGNVIGGGDWAQDRIVPDCIRAIEAGQPIRLRNPRATRPWQHVLEPLSGYVLLGAMLYDDPASFSGAWNFGPSTQKVRTVHEVAQTMVRCLGQGTIEVAEVPAAQHEAALLQLNCDKAHQLMSWYPRWEVDQALAATAEWYGEVRRGVSAKTVTRRQILEYFPELA